MSARSLGEGVLLSLLSVAFTFACAEGAVRMLQRLGRLPRYSMASFATPNAQLNARLVRSRNLGSTSSSRETIQTSTKRDAAAGADRSRSDRAASGSRSSATR